MRPLLKNSLSNLVGGVLPAIASLATVPFIVRGLGEMQYGVYALVTAIVGYFAIIDLNVTAGSVKYLAEFHAKDKAGFVSELISLGLMIYAAIGVVGAVAIATLAPWLVSRVFQVPTDIFGAAVIALRIAAVGFLIGQIQFYLQSIPQGLGRYDVSAKYEAIFGIVASLVTLAVVLVGGGLEGIVLARLALSMVNVLMLRRRVSQLLPECHWARPSRQIVRQVLGFSGFAYLRNVAAVTYSQADKLLIGALAGMQALTFYVVPFTLVNRVFSMTYRLAAVMFPAASALAAKGEVERLTRIYLVAVRYTVFLNGVISVFLIALASALLKAWMGEDFAARSSGILMLVTFAGFLDSITNLPSLINDGLGHPRVTGLLSVVRAVSAVASAYVMVSLLGIFGAAVSQLLVSAAFGSFFVIYVHGRTVPIPLKTYLSQGISPALACALFPALAGWWLSRFLEPGAATNLVVSLFILVTMGVLGCRFVLRREDMVALIARIMPGRAA